MAKLHVDGVDITILSKNDSDYISLTDMVKVKADDSRAADIIKNWIRSRSAIEFLEAWELIYNPDFKVVESDHFKKQAGLPTFTLSVSSWVEKTGAIGIFSKSGKYGGTYAHKDIALEFGSAISAPFKLLLIREFQRLKDQESRNLGLEWDVRRFVSKANYRIQTDAIQEYLIPFSDKPEDKKKYIYAEEGDVINIALFNMTAREWRQNNPDLDKNGRNIRDYANSHQLITIGNLEALNTELIKAGQPKEYRLKRLRQISIETLKSLSHTKDIETLLAESPNTKTISKEKFDQQLKGLMSIKPPKKETDK